MSIAGVGTCSHCDAVVNLHWSRCAVCDNPIETRRVTYAPEKDETLFQTITTGDKHPAFALNAGDRPATPPLRSTPYEPGATVTIHSPLFGIFQAEVIRDDGGLVWVIHPHLNRECAIPSLWIRGAAE